MGEGRDRRYDARWEGSHGIGRHAREVGRRLPATWGRLEPGGGPPPWSATEPLRMARRVRRLPGTTLVTAGYNVALRGWWSDRTVPTIHDLIHVHSRHRADQLKRAYYRAHLYPALRRVPVVLTVSAASRDDLVAVAGVRPTHVEVIGNGISDTFGPEGERVALDGPTVLAYASEKDHKNLRGVLLALARPELADVHLVLVGGESPLIRDLGAPKRAAGRLTVRSGLSDDGLAALVRSVDVVVTLSRYEGFNLPIVEAVASGTAVVASDIPVHREVAAGLRTVRLVPLDDPAAVAEAVADALGAAVAVDVSSSDRAEVRARHDWDDVVRRLLRALDERDL